MQGGSPSSPAGPRLWRPAAQRNVRNSWSFIARHVAAWAFASSHGLSAATSLVNSLLSERYVESMDFGVLQTMKDIRARACRKFFLQGEGSCMELLRSYKELVESLSMMLRAKESMRTYLKGPTSGPLVEFSDRQHLSEDTGDGDGLAVFSALSLSTHEMLAEELINMFLSEIRIKWLIVSELHSLLYSEKVDDHLRKQTSEEMMHNIFLETNLKIGHIIFGEQEHDLARTVQQGSGVKVKREVLQVYLTAWLAEVNIKKSRKDEVLKSASEEIQFSLSG